MSNGQQNAVQTVNDNLMMKAQLEAGTQGSNRDNKTVEIYKVLFEGLDVKRAILHGSFPVPGHGETESMYSGATISGIGKSAVTGVKMKYNADGLFCEFKGAAFVIPLANVKGCWL